MSSSDDLFRVIKSLSPSEKKFFRIQASVRKGEKKYLLLFDAIDRQKSYNEQAIKQKFPSEAFCRNMRVYKKQLYCLIMQHIYMADHDSSPENTIRQYIHWAEIHDNRALYTQAQMWMAKAKDLAYKYEKFEYLVAIIKSEIKTRLRKRLLKEVPPLLEEKEKVQLIGENIREYRKAEFKLLTLVNTLDHSGHELVSLERIMKQDLLQSEKTPLSVTARLSFLNIWHLYYFFKKKYEDAYAVNARILALMEANPYKEPHVYMEALNNFCISQITLGKSDEIPRTLEKMRASSSGTFDCRVFIFNNTLRHYNMIGEFYKSVTEIAKNPDICEHIRIHSPLTMEYMYRHITAGYFGAGMYREAFQTINVLISNRKILSGNDSYVFALLFRLVVYWELHPDDWNFVESNTGSIKRQKVSVSFAAVRDLLVDFFCFSLYGEIMHIKQAEMFHDMKRKLHLFSRQHLSGSIFDCFDFVSWMESKLERRPFREIVIEKNKKQRLPG